MPVSEINRSTEQDSKDVATGGNQRGCERLTAAPTARNRQDHDRQQDAARHVGGGPPAQAAFLCHGHEEL